MMSWRTRLAYAFFPKRCLFCGRVIAPDDTTCSVCKPKVPRMEELCCARCARTTSLCTCRKRRFAFDTCVTAMRYEGEVKRAILLLKQDPFADAVSAMAEEMVAVLRRRTDTAKLEAVTFVPMTAVDRRKREFNQSECLAREVAKHLALPMKPLLRKLYQTDKQKSLPMIARSGNVLGVFDVNAPLVYKQILLVDDLITTGSTLHECAKMLKLYGAETVTAVTFAASVPEKRADEEKPPTA